MSPFTFPVRRPVATSMFFAAIVLLGLVAWRLIPVELLPPLSGESLWVTFFRPGSELPKPLCGLSVAPLPSLRSIYSKQPNPSGRGIEGIPVNDPGNLERRALWAAEFTCGRGPRRLAALGASSEDEET